MRKAAHVAEVKKLTPATDFLQNSIRDGTPANSFILLDTHADGLMGLLQHAGGQTTAMSTTIGDLVTSYLGKSHLDGMSQCSKAAKQDTTIKLTVSGRKPWCDTTAKTRGGCRGLFIVTGGPAIRQPYHFYEVHKLISK